MVKVVIEFDELPRFGLDVLHYVVTDREIAGIKKNLAADPFLGEEVPRGSGMLEYKYRSEIVTYAISQDFRTIYLLTIRPVHIPRGDLTAQMEKWLERLNKLGAIWSAVRGG